jgi:hypothetical protein
MEVDEEAEPKTANVATDVLDSFMKIKEKIKDQPLYDRALFIRI